MAGVNEIEHVIDEAEHELFALAKELHGVLGKAFERESVDVLVTILKDIVKRYARL